MNDSQNKRFEDGINPENYSPIKYHILNDPKGDCLLDLEWYPESEYELDPDKIKLFITSCITETRQEVVRELREKIKKLAPQPESPYGDLTELDVVYDTAFYRGRNEMQKATGALLSEYLTQ